MKATPTHPCPTCGAPKPSGRQSYCSDSCRPRCAVQDCDAGVTGPGTELCSLHYSRQREGSPLRRECERCGVLIEDQPKKTRRCVGHNVCDVVTCNRRPAIKGLCGKHYQHQLVYGTSHTVCATCGIPIDDSRGGATYCSESCRPVCVHPTCNKTARGADDVCPSHQMMRSRHGELRPDTWARSWSCEICGREVGKGSGRRKYCSAKCQQLGRYERPKAFECARCAEPVSLVVPVTKAGQFKRSDSRLCGRCASRPRRYGTTVDILASRHGRRCGICGEAVDMTAGPRDCMRPSIDHIFPRSLGGSDDSSNLQLAHLACNLRKGNRLT